MQLTTEDLYNIVVILVIAIVAARWIKRRQDAEERRRERAAQTAAEPADAEPASHAASDPEPTAHDDRPA